MSQLGWGNKTLRRWLRLVPVVAFASITLLAFNNCGSGKHLTLLDPGAGVPMEAPGVPTPGGNGTDLGNPTDLPVAGGPILSELTNRFCDRAQACLGQTLAGCSIALQNTLLPGVTPHLGMPGPDSFLGVMQNQVDNNMLTINPGNLTSCQAALSNLDCTTFPNNLFQDYISLAAGAASMISQTTQCQAIVSP